jgi:hypothetical protein
MKTIKLMFDYKCFPLWIYNDDNEFIGNCLPNELLDESSIVNQLKEVQRIYDALFEDNEIAFKYKGFSDDEKKQEFSTKVREVVGLIKDKIGNFYNVESELNLETSE